MAKKRKEQSPARDENSPVESFDSTIPNQPVTNVQIFTLRQVAEQYLVGFKPHWWPSIEAHSRNMGFGDCGDLESCKVIIQDWSGGSASFTI